MAAYDFPPCDTCRNIIILITDGIEACDGDPCAVSLELQKKGIVLKPFVIGIGLDPGFKETFDCVGYYFNAQNEDKFKESLGVVITQVMNTTTAQVNLLDENGLPVESNVNMTFFDMTSGKVKYNLIHTINNRGNPDTLYLDHLVTYHLRVNTLPPVEVDNVTIIPGKHTVIAVNTPQGYLTVKTSKNKTYEGMLYSVKKHGEAEILTNQPIGEAEKFLTGKYDIEIPTIPRLVIREVEVLQSHTTSIEIPVPGNVTFKGITNGFGSLYEIKGLEQKWIYNLQPALRNQNILMQPGFYRVTFRQANSKSSVFTVVKDFEVKQGEDLTIELL